MTKFKTEITLESHLKSCKEKENSLLEKLKKQELRIMELENRLNKTRKSRELELFNQERTDYIDNEIVRECIKMGKEGLGEFIELKYFNDEYPENKTLRKSNSSDESPDNEDGEVGSKSLGAYLQQITLLTDADNEEENSDVVKLMTIHAATILYLLS